MCELTPPLVTNSINSRVPVFLAGPATTPERGLTWHTSLPFTHSLMLHALSSGRRQGRTAIPPTSAFAFTTAASRALAQSSTHPPPLLPCSPAPSLRCYPAPHALTRKRRARLLPCSPCATTFCCLPPIHCYKLKYMMMWRAAKCAACSLVLIAATTLLTGVLLRRVWCHSLAVLPLPMRVCVYRCC